MPYLRFFLFLFVLSNCATAQPRTQESSEPSFDNPLAEQRADPWVYKSDAGTYYLIATVPEYDRIVMRAADSINGLKNAEEKTLWNKHDSGPMSYHIWAPELHRVDGKWYIYFAAAEAEDIWKIRMWVLSNDSEDPLQGEWEEEGQITTDRDGFALDATTFEHGGKRYLIWAERDGDGTSLILSEMSDPTTLTGPQIVITKPEYSWERIKYNVNEGPAVIKHDDRLFVTYSASATNDHYAVGLLWIDQDADLMDPANWSKSPAPVLATNEETGRYGPGHNSFTTTPDGQTVMIYHDRDYKEIEGPELENPDRGTRARLVRWTKSGFPDFHLAE
ncbi:family 43 glycosylhydrolase [Lewinella sp. IMCC34183]|uniref:glycoside hydrolase family 43 protein n=1 Tax=Lewinella sp. IMCC34183 TaxID=2248762 RepID=UPI000E22D5AA|nr:family 43 glycosylhydrolase [Lewinella sp. IMCC34183]